MAIKVILAKAHRAQIEDAEIKKELCSVETELNKADLSFREGTVNFVFIKGIYLDGEKKMLTACLFVNKTEKPISELHGVLRLAFKSGNAQIAKTTLDFDEPFMGTVGSDEALLVHLGIPIRGLTENEEFTVSKITGSLEEVRVTYAEGDC